MNLVKADCSHILYCRDRFSNHDKQAAAAGLWLFSPSTGFTLQILDMAQLKRCSGSSVLIMCSTKCRLRRSAWVCTGSGANQRLS